MFTLLHNKSFSELKVFHIKESPHIGEIRPRIKAIEDERKLSQEINSIDFEIYRVVRLGLGEKTEQVNLIAQDDVRIKLTIVRPLIALDWKFTKQNCINYYFHRSFDAI